MRTGYIHRGRRLGVLGCVVGSAALTLMAIEIGATSTAASQKSLTVWDGVYTVAQAERGKVAFSRRCSFCHGEDLDGSEDPGGPTLLGSVFLSHWDGLSMSEIFATVGETMPQNRPATVPTEELAEILSFLLHANKIPPGQRELPDDPSDLQDILFVARPEKR